MNKNRRSSIYDELKKRIVLGRYQPGTTLDEKKICQEFHISRTPYREALMRLEADGLVSIKPQTGVIVSPIDLNMVRDVFEMRVIQEAVAARMAFKRIRPHQLQALREIAKKIESLSLEDDIYSYLELDSKFHEIIQEAQGNRVLKENLITLYNHSMRLWNSIENGDQIKNQLISSIRDISKICAAFDNKDASMVEKLIKNHFIAYSDSFISYFFGGSKDEFIPSEE
jgi:DNA-binding GntR family transcriptional regulator